MPEPNTCPECGSALPAGAPHGLCPKCLLVDKATIKEGPSGLLPTGAPQPVSTVLSLPLSEKPGDPIGRYKLLQKLGEGGCGVVYMAEQEQPIRRRVALKVIKLGMDTKEVIARFEAERQALALMDHPNIAKVLDGGVTSTGRPFFVMELVRGIPIAHYCDENRLSTTQRLELFILVCQAIQHAHQKGIIHRDIKPSNILVADHDGTPVPKVIDFGIAKATAGQTLSDKTLFTAFEQFIGTPAYMSPEQAKLSGLDVDTRSDIYSLGVLLYELLTGKTPFDAKRLIQAGLDEVRRIIREEDPPRPSTRLSTLAAAEQTTVARQRQTEPPKLAGLVRGDLDWIVMKTLEKDRTRRYETASGLAMDLRRFLSNEPVLARPPTKAYRLQKLVRRNKVVFAAASAVMLALLLGLTLSTWLFIRERAARQQARTEAVKSQQVAQFLEDMLTGVGPSVAMGQDTKMLREILDKTAERVGKELTNQPQVEAELRSTIGKVYSDLGDFETAKSMQATALALRQKAGTNTLEFAASMDEMAQVLRRLAQLGPAEAMQRHALELRRKLEGDQNLSFAPPLTTLAQILSDAGKLSEAETLQRQALTLRQKYAPEQSTDLAEALKYLASILYLQKRLPEAQTLDEKALAIERKLLGTNSSEMAMTINDLGTVLYLQDKFPEAEGHFREAVAIVERTLSPDHPARLRLLANLATAVGELGNFAEAEKSQRRLLEARQRAVGPKHTMVAESLSNLARVLQAQHRLAEAEDTERQALAMRRELLGEQHVDVAVSLNHLTTILQDEGKFAEAETCARKALQIHLALRGPDHRDVAGSQYFLASVLLSSGNLSEAKNFARQSQELYAKLLPDDWRIFAAQSLVGAVALAQKQYLEAEPLLLAGYDGMKSREARIPAINKVRLAKAAEWCAELYGATGKPGQAAEWRAKASH